MTLYGYADVGRFGLAHGLLAWARCVCWCHDTGAQILAPRWLRIRIGPYLRRESDKRSYHRLFHSGSQISGIARAWRLSTSARISAEVTLPDQQFKPARTTVVVFTNAIADNERKLFHHVRGRSDLVHQHLRSITRTQFLPPHAERGHIAVHVRLGDFSTGVPMEQVRAGRNNTRLPMEWYVAMVTALRSRLGVDVPVIVYSDGADQDLAPLLNLAGCSRAPRREAITDLLAIAQAAVLVASGSGFSLWGSFLGQVPRVCFPSQRIVRVLPAVDNADLEPECASGDQLALPFIDAVRCRLHE